MQWRGGGKGVVTLIGMLTLITCRVKSDLLHFKPPITTNMRESAAGKCEKEPHPGVQFPKVILPLKFVSNFLMYKLRSLNYSLRYPNNQAHVMPNQTTFGSNSLMSIM